MKKRNLMSALLKIALVGLCSLYFTAATAATSDDKKILASAPCVSPDDCLASGYGVSLRNILFLPTYKQASAMLAGSILSVILTPEPTSTLSMDSGTSQGVMTLIANQGNTASQFLAAAPGIFAPNLVLTPQSKQKLTQAEQQTALNTLNFDSVITPVTYSNVNTSGSADNSGADSIDQPMVANAFIQYVTGLVNPMRASDFSGAVLPKDGSYSSLPQYIADLQKKPEVQDYLTGLRTYAAQLSVGISNFYYLYNERMPIQDPKVLEKAMALVKQTGAPNVNGPLSPLQVEQILATRRINDQNWYVAMQNAVPSTLLRETLFLLAEIPPMLFQLHLDLERILATLSTMQIQQASNSTLMLEQKRDKVDNILKNPEQPKSEAAQAASNASKAASSSELEAAKKALDNQQ